MGQLEWRDTHETTCLNLLYHPEFVYQILSQSHEDYQSYSILHFWLVGWLVGWLVDMSRYFQIVFRQQRILSGVSVSNFIQIRQ